MHSVESFMGAASASFWPMSLRKHPGLKLLLPIFSLCRWNAASFKIF